MADQYPQTGYSGPETSKRTPSKVKTAKRKVEGAAKSAARSTERAAKIAQNSAAHMADDAVSQASQRANAYLETGQSKTEDVIRSISRAFEVGSRSLEQDGMAGTAGYVRAAANGLERAADEVDDVNAAGITGRVEQFVRERPLLTVGALALGGFVFASALKSKNNKV